MLRPGRVIIWTGWGILVFVFGLGALVLSQAITNAVLGAGTYENSSWPKLVAVAIAAIAIWLVGVRLNASSGRALVDPKTGQQVVLRRRHTFFFMPMQYWAPIIVVLGVVFALKP